MLLVWLWACAARGPTTWTPALAAPLVSTDGLEAARAGWREQCVRGRPDACTDLHRSEAWLPDASPEALDAAWWALLDLCRDEHIDACRALGMTWRRGQGRERDPVEADWWFDHASRRGDGHAMGLLAHSALVSGPAPLNPPRADRALEIGCDQQGAPVACAEQQGRVMATAQLRGQANAMAAHDTLTARAEGGDLAARVILARVWLDGVAGEQRPALALELLDGFDTPAVARQAELAGLDPYAGEGLLLLRRAQGVAPDTDDLARACDLGMEPACP